MYDEWTKWVFHVDVEVARYNRIWHKQQLLNLLSECGAYKPGLPPRRDIYMMYTLCCGSLRERNESRSRFHWRRDQRERPAELSCCPRLESAYSGPLSDHNSQPTRMVFADLRSGCTRCFNFFFPGTWGKVRDMEEQRWGVFFACKSCES